jgi:hypothetical protein
MEKTIIISFVLREILAQSAQAKYWNTNRGRKSEGGVGKTNPERRRREGFGFQYFAAATVPNVSHNMNGTLYSVGRIRITIMKLIHRNKLIAFFEEKLIFCTATE